MSSYETSSAISHYMERRRRCKQFWCQMLKMDRAHAMERKSALRMALLQAEAWEARAECQLEGLWLPSPEKWEGDELEGQSLTMITFTKTNLSRTLASISGE